MFALPLVAVAAALLVAAAGCDGRPHAATSGEGGGEEGAAGPAFDGGVVDEIDLTQGEPELAPGSLFGPPRKRSHVDLVRVLRSVASDADAKGVYVRLGGASFALARAQEIGALLGAVRKKIPVVCHADDLNNGALYLAAAGCTRVWVSPAGGVDAVGIAAQLVYARSLFDKLHVGVDFLQVGKFKGAEEPFTRDGPSPEARASLEAALRGLRAAWIQGIATGRHLDHADEIVEAGPYSPWEAKKNGLIDEVGYGDDAKDEAKKLAHTEHVAMRFGTSEAAAPVPKGLSGVLRALSGSGHATGAHVAVLPAVGAITMAPSRSLLGASEGISEKELGRLVTKVTKDASVKAVVVRIDSPGGSALASDLLWKKLMKLREKKPLVFSIGAMAASGGYYLACTGTKIVAEPGSIVGSIGVVAGKLAFGPALEQIGVHAETIAAAPGPGKATRAAYMSPLTAWDDATRARVLSSMQAVYDLFLQRVAAGRKLTVDDVAPSAEGRIFGGVEAKERKLVDELGGFDDARKLAAKLAGLPPDAPFDVVSDQPNLFELLEGDGDG
ncbi:MAG TPA: signal peptide peptidase SppA, partial [Minicystis sp.]|nr:signal peptide peptidase SppA [Minicystis sp.]